VRLDILEVGNTEICTFFIYIRGGYFASANRTQPCRSNRQTGHKCQKDIHAGRPHSEVGSIYRQVGNNIKLNIQYSRQLARHNIQASRLDIQVDEHTKPRQSEYTRQRRTHRQTDRKFTMAGRQTQESRDNKKVKHTGGQGDTIKQDTKKAKHTAWADRRK
jgi:hypothetical protein